MSTLASVQAAAPSAQIRDEGIDLQVSDNGVDGSLSFWVSGADLGAFRLAVAGSPSTAVVIGGYSVSRLVPMLHPYESNCYAYSLRAYPAPGAAISLGGGSTGFSFADYFVDVRFRTPKYDYTGPYPLVTRQRRNGVEMVTRPGFAYQFPSDSKRPNHDVGIPVLTVEYGLTFHRLPALNDDLYDSLAGCVNEVAFLGRPAGTVLYRGCSSGGELTLGGVPSFEATHEFSYRAIPHNQIMRDDGMGFEAPIQVADAAATGTTLVADQELISNPAYLLPIADLNQLFAH